MEDTALITDLGAEGLGFIPVYSAVLKEIARLSRFQTLGITKGLRMEVFAITAQRRLQHPGVGGLFSGYDGIRSNGSLRFSNRVLGDFGGGLEYRFTSHIGVFSEATWNVVDGPKNNFLQVNFGTRFAF